MEYPFVPPRYERPEPAKQLAASRAFLERASASADGADASPMRFIRELLERPANERPFCVIPVGFPAPGTTVPDLGRKPLAEIMVLS